MDERQLPRDVLIESARMRRSVLDARESMNNSVVAEIENTQPLSTMPDGFLGVGWPCGQAGKIELKGKTRMCSWAFSVLFKKEL